MQVSQPVAKVYSLRGKNVLGTELQPCCHSPKTGFFRDGFCRISEDDRGSHSVCAIMTEEFLEYSKTQGNDLSTPRMDLGFPGLKAGDKWCVCAERWQQAFTAGKAPPVVLEATEQRALETVTLAQLQSCALQ